MGSHLPQASRRDTCPTTYPALGHNPFPLTPPPNAVTFQSSPVSSMAWMLAVTYHHLPHLCSGGTSSCLSCPERWAPEVSRDLAQGMETVKPLVRSKTIDVAQHSTQFAV
jgi:hypothetical protein